MPDAIPYSSPNHQSHRNVAPEPPRSRLRFYLIPALLGAVIGGVFLAPYCRGDGDPGGHAIGVGLGGLAGLLQVH